jgi:chemotaxis protein MotB
MIRRKPFDEDESNPDRWLVSYADFITLLFAFFVVMYAISSVNQGKYNQLTSSMGTAFTGNVISGVNQKGLGAEGKIKGQQSSIIKPLPLSHLYNEKQKRERESMAKMGLDVSNALFPLVNDGKVRVIQNERGVRIDINDSLLFNQGEAELSPAANIIINDIAILLKENQRLIQVEGHTDNIPIHNQTFYSNWELSAVRASSVVRMLSSSGITDKRLSALGFGASQPISQNETPDGRAKNRRVSIMVLYEVPTPDDTSNVIKPQKTN